jgi:bifunctional non-homologous end joining protein LigD
MDAVELHPWAAMVDDIEHPDRLIFDLDPGPGIAWEFVVDTALRLRTMLEGEGLRPWPKLTGGKGLLISSVRADREVSRPFPPNRRQAANSPPQPL